MTYEIWDKVVPIYDLTPEQVMSNNSRYRDEDSYIIYRDDGSIYDLVLADDVDDINAFVADIEQSGSKSDTTADITAEEALEIIFGRRSLSREAAEQISAILKGEKR